MESVPSYTGFGVQYFRGMRTTLLMLLLYLTRPALAQEVCFASLLREAADRGAQARLSAPAYSAWQASSYDRDSLAPDHPGWFANWDRSQFVRTEEHAGRSEHVLLDTKGRGALVRFWATWHGPGGGPFTNGTLRIYLDGADEPEIRGPIADLLSGGALIGAPFSESVAPDTAYAHRGHNLFLPIPFAAGCKVTYETAAEIDRGAHTGEALYYQIGYRAHAPGTRVASFRMEQLATHAALLEAVDTGSSKGMDGAGAFDVNFVTATGQGLYLGDTLSLFMARTPGGVRATRSSRSTARTSRRTSGRAARTTSGTPGAGRSPSRLPGTHSLRARAT